MRKFVIHNYQVAEDERCFPCLLGTIITNDLKWNENTATIVQKENARMELLRIVASFGASFEDLKLIYILFVRSHLEQSATDSGKQD